MDNVPKSSDKLHTFYTGLVDTLTRFRAIISPKIKQANSLSGGFVRIGEVGDTPESASQLFTRVSRKDIVAGDRILVGYLESGEAVVLGRLHISGEDDTPLSAAGTLLTKAGGTVSLDTTNTDLRYIRRALPPYSPTGHHQGNGRFYSILNHYPIPTLSGITITANRAYFVPVWVPKDGTMTGISFNITTAVAGNVRVGLYHVDSAFLPDVLIAQSAVVSQSTTGAKSMAFVAPLAVDGGRWYFAAFVAASAMAISGSSVAGAIPALRGGASGNFGENFVAIAQQDLGSTTLPATASAGSGAANTWLHLAGYV